MVELRSDEPNRNDPFTTTHWSVVLAAGAGRDAGSREAFASLYRKYCRPLRAYARRRGHGVEEAEDLLQEFFTRLLEKDYLRKADPERGRFRCFLLTAFKYFLANEWDREHARKRGGGQTRIMLGSPAGEPWAFPELSHDLSPEALYEREWALNVLDGVLGRLRAEYAGMGKEQAFDLLKGYLTGSTAMTYAEAGERLGMSENAVKTAMHRLRARFRRDLREEVGRTLADAADTDEELLYLFSALSP